MVTTENLEPLFDRWKQISFDIKDHPTLTEGESPEILLNDPEKVAPVKLPLIEYYGGKMRYGMHTDMISILIRSLESFTEKTRNGLYVHGRLPNRDQWSKLEDHPAFQFFLNGRSYRSEREEQQEALNKIKQPQEKGWRILLPKGKVTEAQARSYSRMDYNPETKLIGLQNMPTAWYKADFLCSLYSLGRGSANSFIPLLGGFNGFSIGSNNLVSGLVMKASLYIVKEFEDGTGDRIISSPLSQKAREQFDDYSLEI